MRELAFASYLLALIVSGAGCVIAVAYRGLVRDGIAAARALAASNNRLAESYDRLAGALSESFHRRPR
jgi:hypothetical protein